jgi:hypothetical protein
MSFLAFNTSDDDLDKIFPDLQKDDVPTEEEMTAFIENMKQSRTEQQKGMSQRHNSGKVQTREVDPAFILGIGEVLTKSREKYDAFNWQKPTKLSTPYESLFRHLMAFQMGEDVDKESGKHHLLHCATNLMFMYYHITRNPEFSDDRGFKGEENGEDC